MKLHNFCVEMMPRFVVSLQSVFVASICCSILLDY